MKVPRTVVCAVVLVGAGCAPDLTEVRVDSMARFHATVSASQGVDAPDSLSVGIFFAPGIDEAGEARSPASDLVSVAGRSVAPYDVGPSGVRRYRLLLEVEGEMPSTVSVTPVRLPGVAEDPDPLIVPVVRRVGPERLTENGDGDLVVRTTAGEAGEAGRGTESWQLRFGRTPLVVLAGQGLPGDSIVVPGRWLQDAERPDVTATLLARGQARRMIAPGRYESRASWTSRIEWRVELAEPRP